MDAMQSPTKIATKKRKHDDIEEDIEEISASGGDIATATDSPTKKALNIIAASFNTLKKLVWSDGDKDEVRFFSCLFFAQIHINDKIRKLPIFSPLFVITEMPQILNAR